MSIKIKSKNSVVKDKAPVPADLEIGELALNAHQDSPAIYLKDAAGAIRKIAGAGAVGGTDATTAAKGIVQLADAAAITAGTAGRVVDAAQLKSAVDTNDEWTRTGTTIAPKTAGDVVTISAGTALLPGLTPVGDPDTGIFSPGANDLAVSTFGGERVRIEASGRLLMGTSIARSNYFGSVKPGGIQSETGTQSLFQNSSNASGPAFYLGKSRGTTANSNTIVQADDVLGGLIFFGADGTNVWPGAQVTAAVDGTPGANDMPGRLVFSTTADGATTPTERFRITSDGVIAYKQPFALAVNATATLTVANLKSGIVTSISPAATDMTLPTGTDTQAGFSGTYDGFTFEWSVINTGPSLVRVLAGTAHTIVGSGSVSAGTSGRFASVRASANAFQTYRLA